MGIAAGVAKDDFSDALQNTLRNSMANYTRDEGDRLAWDNVQRKVSGATRATLPSVSRGRGIDGIVLQLECCGTVSWRDWNGILRPPGELPFSCCVRYSFAATQGYHQGYGPGYEQPGPVGYQAGAACQATANPIYVWQFGCFQKLEKVVRDSGVIIMGVGIGIAFIEVSTPRVLRARETFVASSGPWASTST